MVKKSKLVRMPLEAYKEFRKKKEKMEGRIKSWTGKETRIKMTDVYKVVAKSSVEIPEGRIIKMAKKGKVKKLRC